MVKNTGKPSEDAFEKFWATLGKRAWLHRLVDAAEVRGRTGRVGSSIRPAPSDYIVVANGKTHFAEVKSTHEKTSFPFSLLRTTQSAIATMILAAGGDYLVYVHCLATDRWYRFPYSLIQSAKVENRGSLKWTELEAYSWTL